MPRNETCKSCPLHKGANTVCVWGEALGERVTTVLVGEAPGAEEDATGRPFIGKSGQALRSILSQMEIDGSCYFANTVKCRPPNNRQPTLAESRKCQKHLLEELEELKPKFIVLLGASAARAFLDFPRKQPRVAQLRGRKNWRYEGASGWKATLIQTYHPAACLRNPNLWPDLIDDLERMQSESMISVEEKVKWSEKVPNKLPEMLALDLETTGLDPHAPKAKILCASMSWKNDVAVVTLDIPSLLPKLKGRTLIGHNLKFDLHWLRTLHGYVHDGPVLDTKVMHHLLHEESTASGLKDIAWQVTGYGGYDLAEGEKGAMNEIEETRMLTYAAHDAAATWRIYHHMLPEIRKQKLYELFLAQGAVAKALCEMEHHGLLLDPAAIREQRQALTLEVQVNTQLLNETLSPDVPVDWSSPKQVGECIYTRLELPVRKRTPNGAPSTDEETLTLLAAEYVDLKPLLALRTASKMLTTYVDGLPKTAHGVVVGGKKFYAVHPSFNPTGTKTGRLSCSKPNLQNIPRESTSAGVKKLFVAAPGHVLIQADYSQIELRVGAMVANEPTMLAAFREGLDLHQLTANRIVGREATKEERTFAKTVNFGIFYGMGGDKLAKATGMTLGQARKFIAEWFKLYPAIKVWLQETEKKAYDLGYTESMFGRRRRLPRMISTRGEQMAAIRQLCNHVVQSSAAEITNLAMAELSSRFLLTGDAWLCANVHDAIVVEAKKTRLERVKNLMQEVMTDPTSLVRAYHLKRVPRFTVPLAVEIVSGESWGEMR